MRTCIWYCLQGTYQPNAKDLRKILFLWAQCAPKKFKKITSCSAPGFGNGKRARKSAQK